MGAGVRRTLRGTLWLGWSVLLGCPGSGSAPDGGRPIVDACFYEENTVQTLVTLGSSSVAGAGASDVEHRFVNLIATAIDVETLVNLGRSGQRAVNVVGALAEQARAAQPDLVVVLAFTDYASSDGPTMAEAWRQVLTPRCAEGARVYFGDLQIDPDWICGGSPTPTGLCYEQSEADMIAAKNAAVAAALGELTNLTLVTVLDDNAAHPDWVTADGHPNDLGHANLAAVFLQHIEQDLQQRVCSEDSGR